MRERDDGNMGGSVWVGDGWCVSIYILTGLLGKRAGSVVTVVVHGWMTGLATEENSISSLLAVVTPTLLVLGPGRLPSLPSRALGSDARPASTQTSVHSLTSLPRHMVKVQIVEEKDQQAHSSPYASSQSSRTSSSISLSSIESDSHVDESLLDRIAALKDIVPPTTRHSLASKVSKTASLFKRTSKIAGNVIWVVTTSALLIGLPLALILEDEAKVVAQENEMLAQQQGAQQVRSRFFLRVAFSLTMLLSDGLR